MAPKKKGVAKRKKDNNDDSTIRERNVNPLEDPALTADLSDDDGGTPGRSGAGGRFAFPSSDSEDEGKKGKNSKERPVIHTPWRFDTDDGEDEKKEKEAKRKEVKHAKREALQARREKATAKARQKQRENLVESFHEFVRSFRKNFWHNLWITGGLLTLLAVGYLKATEEFFSYFDDLNWDQGSQVNHYAALSLSNQATTSEIRKAYRQLSLKWHPDRNPGCEHCEEKFRVLQEAYETLSDPQRRQVYDSSSVNLETIPSRTTSITDQNFHRLVQDSDEVWIIQVFTDFDGLSKHFSSLWEAAASLYGASINFGRINAMRDVDAVGRLPVKIVIYPTIIMLVPGRAPQLFPNIYGAKMNDLFEWIVTEHPDLAQQLPTRESVVEFLQSPAPPHGGHALIVTSRMTTTLDVKAAAYKWARVFKFGVVPSNVIKNEIAEWGITPKPHLIVMATYTDGRIHANQIEQLSVQPRDNQAPSALFKALYRLQVAYAPYLSRQTAEHLCRPDVQARVYCLVVVEGSKSEEADEYAEELSALDISEIVASGKVSAGNTGEEETGADEEDRENAQTAVVVQTVRLETEKSGLLFRRPAVEMAPQAPPAAFTSFWNSSLKKSRLFLMDLDGHRLALNIENSKDRLEGLYYDLEDGLVNFRPWSRGGGAPCAEEDEACKQLAASTIAAGPCAPEVFVARCLYDFSRTFTRDLVDRFKNMSLIQFGVLAIAIVAAGVGVSQAQAVRRSRLAEHLAQEEAALEELLQQQQRQSSHERQSNPSNDRGTPRNRKQS